jgi:hypothetical protein
VAVVIYNQPCNFASGFPCSTVTRDCIIIIIIIIDVVIMSLTVPVVHTQTHTRKGQPTQQLIKGKVTPVHAMKVQGGV